MLRALSTKNNTFVVILPFFLVLAVLRGHSICLWKSKCSSVYRILNYKQFAINVRQLFRLPTCTLYSSKQKINKDFLHVSLKTDVHSYCNLHVFIFSQLSDQKNSSNVYVINFCLCHFCLCHFCLCHFCLCHFMSMSFHVCVFRDN